MGWVEREQASRRLEGKKPKKRKCRELFLGAKPVFHVSPQSSGQPASIIHMPPYLSTNSGCDANDRASSLASRLCYATTETVRFDTVGRYGEPNHGASGDPLTPPRRVEWASRRNHVGT